MDYLAYLSTIVLVMIPLYYLATIAGELRAIRKLLEKGEGK